MNNPINAVLVGALIGALIALWLKGASRE